MNIDLPLETWTDLLKFVPRKQLVQLVAQLDGRQLARIFQFYLHKCGKVTIGNLRIRASPNGNERIIVKDGQELPLADVPMPQNVNEFKRIRIDYFDESVLAFLQEFHRNSLFENIKLDLDYKSLEVMPKLVPLFTKIEAIILYRDIPFLAFLQREYAEKMLASARILSVIYELLDDWYFDWLYSPREDGKPRVLVLFAKESRGPVPRLVELLKKEFMSSNSNRAVSYFIRLYGFNEIPEFAMKNCHNEKLVIKQSLHLDCCCALMRHPLEATKEWIEAMENEEDWEHRNLIIDI